MNPGTLYLMVGVVAALGWSAREPEPGPQIVGMMILLVAWPIFLLAGLAIHGFPNLPKLPRKPPAQIPATDLREVTLRDRGFAQFGQDGVSDR